MRVMALIYFSYALSRAVIYGNGERGECGRGAEDAQGGAVGARDAGGEGGARGELRAREGGGAVGKGGGRTRVGEQREQGMRVAKGKYGESRGGVGARARAESGGHARVGEQWTILVWWKWYYWANPVAWTLYGLLTCQYGNVETDLRMAEGSKQPVK
eukprot:Gb_17948 [translate_table: standard]